MQDLVEPRVDERFVNMKLQEKPEIQAQRKSEEAPPEKGKQHATMATS